MDKLIEFLTSKIGYTIAVVLGFIIPGVMFIFIWNRELYMELDIIKLLLLSFGITFLLFIPIFFICMQLMMAGNKLKKVETDIFSLLFVPIAMTVLEMMLLMVTKILNNEYSILDFINEFGGTTFWIAVISLGINAVIDFIMKKKNKQQ